MKTIIGLLNPVIRSFANRLRPSNPLRKWASKVWAVYLSSTASDVRIRLNNELTWVLPHWRSLDQNYEQKTLASFVETVKPGHVVWDVGAHVGLFSIVAARRVGSQGQVVAWEPTPRAFENLQHHLKANGLEAQTQCFQEAVNDGKTSEIVFQLDAANETSFANRISYNAANEKLHREIKVHCRSLDEWAQKLERRPDIIKMDIEGAEIFALRGAVRLLRGEFGKRPKILLAVHPASIHQYGSTCDELAELVQSLGYKVEKIHAASGTLYDFGEVWLTPT